MEIHWAEALTAVGILGCFYVIGFFGQRAALSRKVEMANFLNGFRNDFIGWVNGNGDDVELYNQIIMSSPKAQKFAGHWGIISNFRMPFQQVVYKQYPIILNALPKVHEGFQDYLLRKNVAEYGQLVDQALLRAIGDFDDKIETAKRQLFSPLKLISGGFQSVVSIPILILTELGLIGQRMRVWLEQSLISKALSASIAIVGLIAGIMSIALGWDSFSAWVASRL